MDTEQHDQSTTEYVKRLVAEINALRVVGDDMARVFRNTLNEFGWSDDESTGERATLDGWTHARETNYWTNAR